MSADSLTIVNRKHAWHKAVPVFRYAAGATLILAVATGADYTLSYLTPVLALGFLAPGATSLTVRTGMGFVLVCLLACFTGVLFSRLFLSFPLVFLPLLALALFHLYYAARVKSVVKVWLIISLLLIPLMSTVSSKLGGIVALSLILNAAMAVGLVWFIYLIFPARHTAAVEKKAIAKPVHPASHLSMAVRSLVVILPVILCFFLFQWTGTVLVMVFVVILSMRPETANWRTGKFMILANLAGGLAAILAFNLFTIVPSFTFLVLVTLLAGLFFGSKVFSGKPAAPLFGTAFSTYLLVLGSVTTSSEGDAGETVWTRILQIGIAVTYVVVAFGLYNHFSRSVIKSSSHNE